MEGEGRYVLLPAESVSLYAESLGVQTSQEVTSLLAQDVSFRIRQIANVSCTLGSHAQ